MLALVGFQIHSSAACAKLVQSLREAGIPLKALHDRALYFLDSSRPLDDGESNRLNMLLNSGGMLPEISGEKIRVLPRSGTQSPWSSKATDILKIAGFSMIRRIERGRFYRGTKD